jgi:hypothetical protein
MPCSGTNAALPDPSGPQCQTHDSRNGCGGDEYCGIQESIGEKVDQKNDEKQQGHKAIRRMTIA